MRWHVLKWTSWAGTCIYHYQYAPPGRVESPVQFHLLLHHTRNVQAYQRGGRCLVWQYYPPSQIHESFTKGGLIWELILPLALTSICATADIVSDFLTLSDPASGGGDGPARFTGIPGPSEWESPTAVSFPRPCHSMSDDSPPATSPPCPHHSPDTVLRWKRRTIFYILFHFQLMYLG